MTDVNKQLERAKKFLEKNRIEDAIDALQRDVSAQQLALQRHLDPEAGVVFGDPTRLRQVVINVLSNAVHYNREGGEVVISGSAEDRPGDDWKPGMVAIAVADTGSGIPAGQSERVFDRFYRLDPSRARLTGGSGLGLAICREVLTVLGGTIRVQSSSCSGTTLEIRVPGRLGSDRPSSKELLGSDTGQTRVRHGPDRGQTCV